MRGPFGVATVLLPLRLSVQGAGKAYENSILTLLTLKLVQPRRLSVVLGGKDASVEKDEDDYEPEKCL